MPSVFVTWKGQCTDLGLRMHISDRIEEVAKLADALLGQDSRRSYGTLPGEGLAEAGLFPADCVEPVDDKLVRVSRVRCSGWEFRLSDPRGLYPGDDRVSFIFANVLDAVQPSPTRTEHSGVLVLVEDAEQCKLYRNPLIQAANFYLATPNVHLRYFAEDWMDRLLAFIRHFYMPGLHYWRYTDLPGADRFAHIDPDDWQGHDQAWIEVKRALVEEAAEWVPKGREVAAMFEHVRRAGTLPGWWLSKPYEPLQLDIAGEPANEDEQRELAMLLIFSRADFEQAARAAIFGAGKGLDLHHVPLRFRDLDLSLRTALDPSGTTLQVEVRFASPDAPAHAVAADEVAAPPSGSAQS